MHTVFGFFFGALLIYQSTACPFLKRGRNGEIPSTGELNHRKLPANLFASPLNVACGATANVVYAGVTWVPDTPYANGGGLVVTSAAIANPIAATERYWPAPLSANSGEQIVVGLAGVYTVTIYLAERYFKQAGQRLFNINIGDGTNNRNMFATNIDLYAQLGYGVLGAFPVDVVVTSGTININFVASINNPKLSAFSVVFKGPLSAVPTQNPSYLRSKVPTAGPSVAPSLVPSTPTTSAPTAIPTTKRPTVKPSLGPSVSPSVPQTVSPSLIPSLKPTYFPSSLAPSSSSSISPSALPSPVPSLLPTTPTLFPSIKPSANPSRTTPSLAPSTRPVVVPTSSPTPMPTSVLSTFSPTARPSAVPSVTTTKQPTKTPSNPVSNTVNYAFAYPICAKTAGAPVAYSPQRLCSAYAGIKAQFLAQVNALQAQNTDASKKQLASMYGKAVRMVFHDAVDLDLTKPDLMGADGCIGDAFGSAGLIEPTSPIFTVYEPIYQAYCDQINRADFFVLVGKLVIETAEPTHSIKLSFQYGRRESYDCSAGIGRDPDAQEGMHAIQQSYIVQMGLTYEDAVLLSGAHTLGHVNPESSRYDGHPGWKQSDYPRADPNTVNAWDQSPTVFDNDYYFQVRNIPWATIYNNGSTFATGRTNSNIWIDMSCGSDENSYPNAVTVNTCLTPSRPLARMMIALNTDMIMTFPMDNSDRFSSAGGHTGSPLQHCVDNVNEVQDVPFAKHYPNQPGREMRCYGPTLRRDTVWPPNNRDNIGFPKMLESASTDKGVIDENTDQPFTDPDPIGLNLAAAQTFAIFKRYSVNSYQDGTAAGLAAHNLFIRDFAVSWTNMVTAGYTNSYNAKAGKLGTLASFDFSTQCPAAP